MTARLHVVVRADLPAGSRAVQAVHAARAFADQHPELEREWFATSNTLALLEVDDEPALERLSESAAAKGVAAAGFREPDLGDSLTAIAIAPAGKKLCQGLRLALGGR